MSTQVSDLLSNNNYPFPYPTRKQFPNSYALIRSHDDGNSLTYIIDPIRANGNYIQHGYFFLTYKDINDNVIWVTENVYHKKNEPFRRAVFFLGDVIYTFVGNTLAAISVKDGSLRFGDEITPAASGHNETFFSMYYSNKKLKVVSRVSESNAVYHHFSIREINTETLTFNVPQRTSMLGNTCKITETTSVISIASPTFVSGHNTAAGAPTLRMLVEVKSGVNSSTWIPISAASHPDIPIFERAQQISPDTIMLGVLRSEQGHQRNPHRYQNGLYWELDTFKAWCANIIEYHTGYKIENIN